MKKGMLQINPYIHKQQAGMETADGIFLNKSEFMVNKIS